MDEHPLDSARLKAARAREHFKTIDKCIKGFLSSKPYRSVPDADPDGAKHRLRARTRRALPADELAGLIGDCIHNLRASLDHIAWRISEDYSGQEPGDTQIQFPIFRTRGEWNRRGKSQIKRVGPYAMALMDALQPYHADNPLTEPLWVLREFDNMDKHKSVVVAVGALDGSRQQLKMTPVDAVKKGDINFPSTRNVEDGVVLVEVTIDPPNQAFKVEADFVFDVMFAEPPIDGVSRLFVLDTLRKLVSHVEWVIAHFDWFYTSGNYDDEGILADPANTFES